MPRNFLTSTMISQKGERVIFYRNSTDILWKIKVVLFNIAIQW
jgi:hypothetical protein